MRDLRRANERLAATTEAVCEMLGNVRPNEVAGRSRLGRVATARHIVAWAMVRIHKFSLTDTGMAMQRNHASIIHSIKIVEGWNDWPQLYITELQIIKNLKSKMERKEQIKAEAERYGIGEYTRNGFITGAEWADANPANDGGYKAGYDDATDKALEAIESYTDGLLTYFKHVMEL